MSDNEAIRGDTKKWSIAIVDQFGDPFDLTDCTVWFTAKTAVSNDLTDTDAIIQHKIVIDNAGAVTSADGFELGGIHPTTGQVVAGAANGVLTQVLADSESTTLTPGSYVYDLQILTADGETYTPINGLRLTILEDVTRSAS